jgi:hypothetical protein
MADANHSKEKETTVKDIIGLEKIHGYRSSSKEKGKRL